MKKNHKLTIIYPLIDPDDIAAKTLQSLINQKFKDDTKDYQDFKVQIFLNGYSGTIKDLIKKYKIFADKKVEIKIYKKDYGQFKNLKKCFRNIKSDYFILATKGIFYFEKYIHNLIRPIIKNPELLISTCEFGICDEDGKEFSHYPKTKMPFKIYKNLFKQHFMYVKNINSAGTKINGIIKTSILNKVKFSNNLDWDKLFLYQASLCGPTIHNPLVLAKKLIKKKLIRNLKITTDIEGYEELSKIFDLDIFHHRSKTLKGKIKHILLTKDWISADTNYEVLVKLRDHNTKNLFKIFIKYDLDKSFAKQLFSAFYKKYPLFLGYFESYNFYLYVKFLFLSLRNNKKFFLTNLIWAFKSLSEVFKRKKIFSFKRSSFFKIDYSRYSILYSFLGFKKTNNKIFYTAARNFMNETYKKNKLSGAIKSSENLLENIKTKNKVNIYYPPKIIPKNPFKLKEIKKIKSNTIPNLAEKYLEIKNNISINLYDFYIFQKTLDYQFFNLLGSNGKKNVVVIHNIEFIHYFKKNYLNYFVSKLRKKLIFRNLNLNNKSKNFLLLLASIILTIDIKTTRRTLKEFFHNYFIYKRSKFIIKTILVESIFDKIFKKKIFLFAPVVKEKIDINNVIKDKKFIYLSCIGSGNKNIYGDLQLLNFINFLKNNYNYIYENKDKFKIMISGETDRKVVNFMLSTFDFLECKIITPEESLEKFLEENLIVNFIIDENSTGIRTKFYDNIFAGNISVFKDHKQCSIEIFNYYQLIKENLIFDVDNPKKLISFLNELKFKNLEEIKLKNKIVAKNYNETLKEQNNLSLAFINGLN